MAKDPAFLFYPNDWIGGTMGMTFEEKGAYMELLMLQFNRGHMTSHMIGQTVGQLWVNIKDKFVQDSNGLWYNERLDLEKNRRKKYTESRRNNLSGKNKSGKKDKKTLGHMDGHKTSHMENENINEDKDNKEIGGVGERTIKMMFEDKLWLEQFKMKHKEVGRLKEFWQFLSYDLELKDIDGDLKKAKARAGTLAISWNSIKQKEKPVTIPLETKRHG